MKFVVSILCALGVALMGTGCASSSKSAQSGPSQSGPHWAAAAADTDSGTDAGWTLRPVSDNP